MQSPVLSSLRLIQLRFSVYKNHAFEPLTLRVAASFLLTLLTLNYLLLALNYFKYIHSASHCCLTSSFIAFFLILFSLPMPYFSLCSLSAYVAYTLSVNGCACPPLYASTYHACNGVGREVRDPLTFGDRKQQELTQFPLTKYSLDFVKLRNTLSYLGHHMQ